MKHDVRMRKEATQTDEICPAGVNRLRRTATTLALAAFVLSLGCQQVRDSSEDGDDGGASGSGGSSGSGVSGSAGTSGTRGSSGNSGAGGTDGDSGAGGTDGDSGAGGTDGDSGAGGTDGDSGAGGTDGDSGAGGTDGDSGAGGTAGDSGAGGSGGSCDAAFADIHWSTPSCPSLVCYDTLLSSDGTYRKQRIVIGGGGAVLFCEHGTWQMLDCATLAFVPCKGDPYQQAWSHSPGVFKLQGVQYDVDSFGNFNCGPNDC